MAFAVLQKRFWFVALSLLVPSALANECLDSSGVRDILEKMQGSHQTTTYQGTFLRELSGERQFVKVDFDASAGAPNAPLMLQRLNGSTLDTPSLWRAPVGGSSLLCSLTESYGFEVAEGPVVAGYPTTELLIKPRDSLRLAYRLNIDPTSGLVLKSLVFATDGKLLERNEFATVAIRTGESMSGAATPGAQQPTVLPLQGLPKGFVARRVGGGSFDALHISDGVASAIVTREPMVETIGPGEGAIIHGSTLTYTRGGQLTGGQNILISVVGDVPIATARMIAESARVLP
jgi:negative regulator of sigma E activity